MMSSATASTAGSHPGPWAEPRGSRLDVFPLVHAGSRSRAYLSVQRGSLVGFYRQHLQPRDPGCGRGRCHQGGVPREDGSQSDPSDRHDGDRPDHRAPGTLHSGRDRRRVRLAICGRPCPPAHWGRLGDHGVGLPGFDRDLHSRADEDPSAVPGGLAAFVINARRVAGHVCNLSRAVGDRRARCSPSHCSVMG